MRERFIQAKRGGIFPLRILFDGLDDVANNAAPVIGKRQSVQQWKIRRYARYPILADCKNHLLVNPP